MALTTQKNLSPAQGKELLEILKTRFEKNRNRHPALDWNKVQAKLEGRPEKLWSLSEMERTGGEPDVVGLDPKTGEFVPGGVAGQTEQVLKNVSAVLEAAGSSLDQVVKTTVFLADMKEFSAMNEVYAKFFSEPPPARATVAAAGLPRDARVEIEVVALVSE